MPLYNCDLCNFSSKIKTHYNRHLKTFKHLRKVEESLIVSVSEKKEPKKSQKEPKRASKIQKNAENVEKNPEILEKSENFEDSDKLICKYCFSIFKTVSNKRRHELHRCKNYNAVIERNLIQKEKEIKQLKKQFKEDKDDHKKQIELLLSKVGNTTITNNNIQLNSYGNEDMSHITDDFKTNLLKVPYGMIPKMIEAVHFNKSKPENKNILMTNKNDNKIKIYSGGRWVYKNKDEILKKIMDGNYFILDEHYEEICTKIDKVKLINYEIFREKYDEKDKNVLNQIKKNSELVLLNNR